MDNTHTYNLIDAVIKLIEASEKTQLRLIAIEGLNDENVLLINSIEETKDRIKDFFLNTEHK